MCIIWHKILKTTNRKDNGKTNTMMCRKWCRKKYCAVSHLQSDQLEQELRKLEEENFFNVFYCEKYSGNKFY